MTLPTVWSIAGSDCSSGAGIQADLLTFHYLNVHGCTIITAATAQNADRVQAINPLPVEQVKTQLEALQHSFPPAAIKLGMLGCVETIDLLEKYFQSYQGKIVLDPVMTSSSGATLFNTDHKHYIQKLTTLFPYVDLLTPNLPEVEAILNCKIHSYDDIVHAAQTLLSFGVKNVVIKAGHFEQSEQCHDYWTNGSDSFWLSQKRYAQKNYRGTGCVFSSAVTASLACNHTLKDALVIAKMVVSRGIREAFHHTENTAYLYHASLPDHEDDLPFLADMPLDESRSAFPDCGEKRIGLYPVVEKYEWLKKLLPLGVSTIQLRIKDKQGVALEEEIKAAIALARQYEARLFINDHWELAIAHGAYGVHLGMEDLNSADLKKIHAAGLRLGVSTHCFHEVARAHALCPSYYAFGPLFPTSSKIMSFMPQGLEKLNYWRRVLRNHSLVAIGGINADKIADVLHAGADGIAMISAITQAEQPEETTRTLLKMLDEQL